MTTILLTKRNYAPKKGAPRKSTKRHLAASLRLHLEAHGVKWMTTKAGPFYQTCKLILQETGEIDPDIETPSGTVEADLKALVGEAAMKFSAAWFFLGVRGPQRLMKF